MFKSITLMKTKLLLGVSFLFYFAGTAIACPVYQVGKMYIIDEQGKPVPDAVVYRYYSLEDSFRMVKDRFRFAGNEVWEDTNAYIFWGGGGRWRITNEEEQKKPADKYLRIQAKGYADVIIRTLEFTGDWDAEQLPVLKVTMYGRKYFRKGELFTLIDKYVCETALKVKDSMVLGFSDYVQAMRSETAVETAGRNAAFVVRTYPNPVVDKLSIDIADPITRPYKATLTDMQGKDVSELKIEEQHSILDMEWQSKGMYYIRVYDPDGILLYSLKFVKS